MLDESRKKTKSAHKFRATLIALLLVCVTTAASVWALLLPPDNSRVVIGDTHYRVEVVDDEVGRSKGLSGRYRLDDGSGMLFVFDESDTYGFWMRDMNFSIDIIWVSDDFEIVHIETEVSPDTYPEVFYPSEPARYVLEINAGDVDRHRIKTGEFAVIDL